MSDTLVAGGHRPIDDWSGELTALESRAETESLEALHVQRRQILPEYAYLRAMHGAGGKWDNKRKALLEAMKIRARDDMTAKGEKITESAVDARGHADDQYVSFIDQGIANATRYVELETEISEIEEKIKGREIALMCYSSETRLGR